MAFFQTARCSWKLPAAIALAAFLLGGFSAPAAAQVTIDWPTFGGSPERTGYNPSETILSTATVPGLKLHWQASLGAQARYQPSLVRQVATATGTFDLLIVTLPTGSVVALDAATGNQIWSTSFATTQLPCYGETFNVGIGEPATLDVKAGRVYVADAGGFLHALAIGTGAELAGYPVEIIDSANLAAETWVHFASPTLVGSTLYLTTAAFCENDQIPYHGQVIMFDTTQAAVAGRFYPMGNGAIHGGGLWGAGGVAAESDGPHLWIATGNALPAPQTTGNAEKIVELDKNLKEVAKNGPVLNPSGDLDFGSTPLLFKPEGCPRMLTAMNKSGLLVVYNRNNIPAGPTQVLQVTAGGGSSKFFGMPAYDPVTRTVFVSNPKDSAAGTYLHGLLALQVTSSCQLSLLWQQTIGENGTVSPSIPPTVANGVVWISEGTAGQIAAFDAATGAALWNSGTLVKAPSLATPLVVNGQMFVAGANTMFAFGL
jgi:hypothetical protein